MAVKQLGGKMVLYVHINGCGALNAAGKLGVEPYDADLVAETAEMGHKVVVCKCCSPVSVRFSAMQRR